MFETSLKRAVLAYLKTLPGVVARKRLGGPAATPGDPDIYGSYRGRHFEIELKAPGQSPTLLQLHRLEEWRKSGAITGVAHSVEEVKKILHDGSTEETD